MNCTHMYSCHNHPTIKVFYQKLKMSYCSGAGNSSDEEENVCDRLLMSLDKSAVYLTVTLLPARSTNFNRFPLSRLVRLELPGAHCLTNAFNSLSDSLPLTAIWLIKFFSTSCLVNLEDIHTTAFKNSITNTLPEYRSSAAAPTDHSFLESFFSSLAPNLPPLSVDRVSNQQIVELSEYCSHQGLVCVVVFL